MRDRILIEGLQVNAMVGVHAHERDAPQPLVFDIALDYDNRTPAASDALADAVDYAAVCERVRGMVAGLRPQLLETLAEALASDLIGVAGVRRARIGIRKPQAARALGAASVGVEIERDAGR